MQGISMWGLSSAGRAPDLHSGGQEFDPPRLHQLTFAESEQRPGRSRKRQWIGAANRTRAHLKDDLTVKNLRVFNRPIGRIDIV